jgi:hypothetical protein
VRHTDTTSNKEQQMVNEFRLNSVPEEGVLVAVVDDCSSAHNAPRLGRASPFFLGDEQINI